MHVLVPSIKKERIKVAEHSCQVPIQSHHYFSNIFAMAPFFARVKLNHRSIYSRILARVCVVAMAMRLVKNKA